MNTKLDKREELIKKIKSMQSSDFQKVSIFISGMEAQKLLVMQSKNPNNEPQKTA